jgi:hypothetical protein
LSFWLFIWILLSGALIGFSVWSFYISHTQKQAWRAFAEKNKLRFDVGKPLSTPEVTGNYDDYVIGLLTSEHTTADSRGTRKLTAVEVALKSEFPFAGAVASGGMVPLVRIPNFGGEVQPTHESWDPSYIARSVNTDAMEGYLTKERLDILTTLMKVKNFWVVFIFREEGALLRVDTPDPLQDAAKLESFVKRLIAAARKLELSSGEGDRLMSLKGKKRAEESKKAAVVAEPESVKIELELEEDDS